jgi:poly(beta-D-mannuronate) lyase
MGPPGRAAGSDLVRSIPDLQARIARAAAGDVIVVADGAYTATAAIVVECAGTADRPILIRAETPGGVAIAGRHGFTVTSPAAFVEIDGFRFTHAAGETSIGPGATHIRFTHNVFENAGKGAYLTIAGDDAQIDANEFRNKTTLGNMIDVRGTGTQVAQRVWIHHNYFHDFKDAGGNGAETIRFGHSDLSLSKGLGLVEHNLFARCTGENELITNKSCANTYRYNTFVDSPKAQLTLRHGNDCLVYGNVFRGTDGIRIFGDRHRVFGNYLERNTTGIQIGNGDGEVADGARLTSHDRPDGTVITFNTLVDNARSYFMGRRPNGLGATHTVFAHNVIQGGGEAARIEGPYPYAEWHGNVLWRTAGPGSMPKDAYEIADPRLVASDSGLLRPGPGGPVLAGGHGDDPPVAVDADAMTPLTPESLLQAIRRR